MNNYIHYAVSDDYRKIHTLYPDINASASQNVKLFKQTKRYCLIETTTVILIVASIELHDDF